MPKQQVIKQDITEKQFLGVFSQAIKLTPKFDMNDKISQPKLQKNLDDCLIKWSGCLMGETGVVKNMKKGRKFSPYKKGAHWEPS